MRFTERSSTKGLTKKRPEKALTEPKPRTGGRNSYGRITSRRRGGGHKKLYRIYREEGLAVKRRRGRKRARGSRTPMPVAQRPNDRWSLDARPCSSGVKCRW